jgi:hypothetical protein
VVRLVVSLLVCVLIASPVHAAGALDRFEDAHRPAPSPKPKPHDDSKSSSSSSTSSNDDDDDDDGGSGSSDESGAGAQIALLFACMVPPFGFACFQPPHRVSVEVYDSAGNYIRPPDSPDADVPALFSEASFTDKSMHRARWIELGLLGFFAANERWVGSHELAFSAWLGPVRWHSRWEHFYETVAETGELDHLDLVAGHFGANVLGPWVPGLELYLLAGAMVVHGEAWTPAFDVGLEARIHPVEPLALASSAMLSIFGEGPVLLDMRLEAGVALGQVELRAGPRWLYQGEEAQGFWGPTASLTARF